MLYLRSKPQIMRKTIITVVLHLLIILACAQSPQGMNYQAVVRNNLGIPLLNQNVGFRFNIRANGLNGTIIYAETHSPTTDQFGNVALVIGQGNVVTGNFSTIPWSSGNYYNEVLIDNTGGTNYISMGALKLWSVPYAYYADTARYAEEHQTLSLSGNNLTISNGNTVALPTNGGSNTPFFPQSSSVGIGYTYNTATQETGVDAFVITANWSSGGLNWAGPMMVNKDPLTGVYQVTGTPAQEGPCSGTNVFIHGATTHQGNVFYVYTNNCATKKFRSNIGNGDVTMDVLPTNSNGVMFSDGQFIYINNNGTNFYRYLVNGNQFTFQSILALNTSTCSVTADGLNYYSICSGYISKYDLTGAFISMKPANGSGLVNIDNNRIYILGSSLSPASTTPTYVTNLVMTPISKP